MESAHRRGLWSSPGYDFAFHEAVENWRPRWIQDREGCAAVKRQCRTTTDLLILTCAEKRGLRALPEANSGALSPREELAIVCR